jgi:hypothetical protein
VREIAAQTLDARMREIDQLGVRIEQPLAEQDAVRRSARAQADIQPP